METDCQGHFNRPKLPPHEAGPDEATLMARVKKSMEIDAQRGLWARRIRSIQILSGIVMVYLGAYLLIPSGQVSAGRPSADSVRAKEHDDGDLWLI